MEREVSKQHCTYVPDFLCHDLAFPFRFCSLSRTEHASERPDPIRELLHTQQLFVNRTAIN
jgi:hypothetical protein